VSDARQAIAEGIRGVARAATHKRRPALRIVPPLEVAPEPDDPEAARALKEPDEDTVTKSVFVPILKADKALQIITGVVLRPEVVDAHGDIMSADVIRESAHKFLAAHNKQTKLKLQHKSFKAGRFDLVESFIAPMDLTIGDKIVKGGSWVMSVRVNDAAIWKQVQDKKITGFSIGGRAKVKRLVE
jgi:hypothetical protein